MLISAPELLARVLGPEPKIVWRIGLIVGTLLTALGMVVPGIGSRLGLALLVALSVVAWNERLTARLTALAVLASLWLMLYDTARSVQLSPPVYVGLTLLLLSLGISVCWIVRRTPDAPVVPTALPMTEEVWAGHQVIERAAAVLARLSGATHFTVQRIDNVPDAVQRLKLSRPPTRSGFRRVFRQPALQTPVQEAGQVWTSLGGDILVHLNHPGQSEALIRLNHPRAPVSFVEDAARVLQMQIERAALLQEVHQHRELLQELVYAFSHDLRTPITASILNTQAALSGAFGPLPEEFRGTLRSSLEAHQGLLAISDQLMLLAEYESGGPAGDDSTVVDLEGVLRTVLDDLTARADARAIQVELTVETLSVRGHRFDLRRVFQNLLDNAVKFSPPSSVVCIRLRRDESLVVVEVRDRGRGVPAEQQAYLFQRFRQASPGSGSGIGLYLTRRIVERHGGVLQYRRDLATETRPAETVFSVCLPYVEKTLS